MATTLPAKGTRRLPSPKRSPDSVGRHGCRDVWRGDCGIPSRIGNSGSRNFAFIKEFCRIYDYIVKYEISETDDGGLGNNTKVLITEIYFDHRYNHYRAAALHQVRRLNRALKTGLR